VKDSGASHEKELDVNDLSTARQAPGARTADTKSRGRQRDLGLACDESGMSKKQTPTVRLPGASRSTSRASSVASAPSTLPLRLTAVPPLPTTKANSAITVKVAHLKTTKRTIASERAQLLALRRAMQQDEEDESRLSLTPALPETEPELTASEGESTVGSRVDEFASVDARADVPRAPADQAGPKSGAPAALETSEPPTHATLRSRGGYRTFDDEPESNVSVVDPPRRRLTRFVLVAAAAVVGVAGFAIGSSGRTAVPSTGVQASETREAIAGRGNQAVEPTSEPASAASEPTSISTSPSHAALPGAGEPTARGARAQVPGAALSPAAPESGTEAVGAAADASSRPKGLDRAAASSLLARLGARAMSCSDAVGGDGPVSVTFLPDGSSENVRVTGTYAGTAVAGCVEQVFRAARVAPFEGPATTVFYTVKLPGDGKTLQ
jgi:hypothetical protein